MWVYELRTGKYLRDIPTGVELLATGYSGFEQGKNNPAKQSEKNVGPLPTGAYLIGEVRDSPDHGPLVMPLVPLPQVWTYGRGSFLIHGDSREHPGAASHGCIILPRQVRERIATSPDRLLIVVTGGLS